MAQALIGVSGWRYPRWRGDFYPKGLPQRLELTYAAERMTLDRGERLLLLAPTPELVCRVAGRRATRGRARGQGRPLHHAHEVPARRRGPVGQLLRERGAGARAHSSAPCCGSCPRGSPSTPIGSRAFFELLPRTTAEAAALAEQHDDKLSDDRALTTCEVDQPLRHALEPRHASFDSEEARALCARHGVAVVVADSAGRWPVMHDATSDFRYVRLHGETELYASGYTDESLDRWAATCRRGSTRATTCTSTSTTTLEAMRRGMPSGCSTASVVIDCRGVTAHGDDPGRRRRPARRMRPCRSAASTARFVV